MMQIEDRAENPSEPLGALAMMIFIFVFFIFMLASILNSNPKKGVDVFYVNGEPLRDYRFTCEFGVLYNFEGIAMRDPEDKLILCEIRKEVRK